MGFMAAWHSLPPMCKAFHSAHIQSREQSSSSDQHADLGTIDCPKFKESNLSYFFPKFKESKDGRSSLK